MRHNDQDTLGRFCFRWLLMLVALSVYGVVGSIELDDLEQAAMEKDAQPMDAQPPLSFPIQYDATVTQKDADGVVRTRYYTRKSNKETQR